MKPANTETLERRIKQLRIEIDALIDARVQATAKESPGVPVGVIRNMLTAGAPACSCAQYMELFARAKGSS